MGYNFNLIVQLFDNTKSHCSGTEVAFDLGAIPPPNFFFKKNKNINQELILVILLYKIELCPFSNIINSFKSDVIVTNFSTIFL